MSIELKNDVLLMQRIRSIILFRAIVCLAFCCSSPLFATPRAKDTNGQRTQEPSLRRAAPTKKITPWSRLKAKFFSPKTHESTKSLNRMRREPTRQRPNAQAQRPPKPTQSMRGPKNKSQSINNKRLTMETENLDFEKPKKEQPVKEQTPPPIPKSAKPSRIPGISLEELETIENVFPNNVSWPLPKEAVEALEKNDTALSEALKTLGTLRRDQAGNLIKFGGKVGSVFVMDSPEGESFAIKLFTYDKKTRKKLSNDRKNPQKIAIRLQHVKNHFRNLEQKGESAPEFPESENFEFIPDALKIGKEHLPVLVSPFFEGESLVEFVTDIVDDGQGPELAGVADLWVGLVTDMENAQWAHGDIHGSNIRVVKNSEGEFELKFIDFESSYVPKLKDTEPDENGHQDYQHPYYHYSNHVSETDSFTNRRPFNEKMDRYSAFVVYVSLRVLALRPNMFSDYNDEGDELIFQGQRDFKEPIKSDLFQELIEQTEHPELSKLALKLYEYTTNEPESEDGKIPRLKDAIDDALAITDESIELSRQKILDTSP